VNCLENSGYRFSFMIEQYEKEIDVVKRKISQKEQDIEELKLRKAEAEKIIFDLEQKLDRIKLQRVDTISDRPFKASDSAALGIQIAGLIRILEASRHEFASLQERIVCANGDLQELIAQQSNLRQEVRKFEHHKSEWEAACRKEMIRKEQIDMDEISVSMFVKKVRTED
jgi:chromosome segregation ATPase